MASGSETNLSCPVCHDVYKDPVLLSCRHSFCVACLQSWWRRREVLECPVCKHISGRKNPPRILALNNLCEAFLLEQEKRIAAVREEQKEKCDEVKKRMKDLKKRISLSDIIIKTKNELRAEDVSFLRCYEATAERVQQRPLMNDPQPLPGRLLDKVKHIGNLTFDIWRTMNDQYFPVILDPNTAHSGLRLTKDLTSVKWGNVEELPDNPERFDSSSIILGCEGFTTGIHSWEVEVGESQHWTLGVVPESVKRKGLLGSHSGLWTLAFHKGTYKAFSPTHPVFYPPVKKHLQKIRVHLNCDAGVISFSDPNMLIHSFQCRSTEALFPFLGTTDKYLLKIQPDTICVLNNTNFICDDRASSDPEEELIDDGDDQVTSIFHDD
ncbi:hypothetical protein XENOCAPTIV_024877 [Xenoophorus captivus]|uniref:Uncharacterized protein n=1 Tax=Xenoophorus captivus TaxID=1517983 RepID=A0ABV0Q644_9TELE